MTSKRGPLSPQDERAWALVVGMMTWLPVALDGVLSETTRLTHTEYQTMRWLSETEARSLHMSTLADSANVTPSHLSRIVSRLENQGWIRRTPDANDGRFTLAQLTESGAQIVAETTSAYDEAVRSLLLDRIGRANIDKLGEIAELILEPLKPECVHIVRATFDR